MDPKCAREQEAHRLHLLTELKAASKAEPTTQERIKVTVIGSLLAGVAAGKGEAIRDLIMSARSMKTWQQPIPWKNIIESTVYGSLVGGVGGWFSAPLFHRKKQVNAIIKREIHDLLKPTVHSPAKPLPQINTIQQAAALETGSTTVERG